jgi:hypothetical protein
MFDASSFDNVSLDSLWTAFWSSQPSTFISGATVLMLIGVIAATAVLALIVADQANEGLSSNAEVDDVASVTTAESDGSDSACGLACPWEPLQDRKAA